MLPAPSETPARDRAGLLLCGVFKALDTQRTTTTTTTTTSTRPQAATCDYEYEMQQYSGYAYDTSVIDARARREVHEAFSADFERTYPSALTATRLCRVPTLWQCLKNAFHMPRA